MPMLTASGPTSNAKKFLGTYAHRIHQWRKLTRTREQRREDWRWKSFPVKLATSRRWLNTARLEADMTLPL